MSFSLSALAGKASSIYSAVSTLFGGSGGVTLGQVTFQGMEVPEHIKWGGSQTIVKQRYPGGTVNLNAMGIDFANIAWSGIFDGSDAVTRSRQLYAMMNAAAIVSLSWNDRSYSVLVAEYTAEDTKTNWIPYSITCVVLRDETLSSAPPAPSLLSRVTADIAGAIGVTPAQLTAGVGSALQTAQVAANVLGAVTGGSKAALALAGAVNVATGVINNATALANSQVAGIVVNAVSTGSIVLPAGSALSGIANMGSALAASANLAALPVIGGLVGRVTTNLANAST